MNAPFRPIAVVVPGTSSHRLIRGVMRMELDPLHVERVVIHHAGAWRASLVDTGEGDEAWKPDRDSTIHILWQADEDDAWIEADGELHPIAPGDTMSVPGGVHVRFAAGMLLVAIEADARSLRSVLPPSHGVETFAGYNRRTDYQTPSAFSLQRWKVTQPLIFPPDDADYAMIDLAAPLAITWPGGTDLIGRGECRVVPADTGPITLLPDGLGYALVIR